MADNFNPYEELNRTRKAAVLATSVLRNGMDFLPDTPEARGSLRSLAIGLGLIVPSEETLDLTIALVNGTTLPRLG